MTTQPEAAMTREQVLEEAERKLNEIDATANSGQPYTGKVFWDDWLSKLAYDGLRFRKALASTRQEPAPAADAEEVDQQIDSILERHQGAMTKAEYKAAGDEIRALIRRYAGDGGVTDEMVEAACKSMADDVLGVKFDDWADDAKQSYRPHMRAAIEAAARATIDAQEKRIAAFEKHCEEQAQLIIGLAHDAERNYDALTAERQRREEAERAGIERAVNWHEGQARKTMIAHKILFHQNSATDLRKLSPSESDNPPKGAGSQTSGEANGTA